MPRRSSKTVLDEKIIKARADVEKTKAAYDKAVKTLKALEDKKNNLKQEEIVEALMKSDKSLEDIMAFLKNE